jgi:hypothetical protein
VGVDTTLGLGSLFFTFGGTTTGLATGTSTLFESMIGFETAGGVTSLTGKGTSPGVRNTIKPQIISERAIKINKIAFKIVLFFLLIFVLSGPAEVCIKFKLILLISLCVSQSIIRAI